ncbi:hypothetical protein AX774_g2674 [Zancudomyces culisetae]|uniref:Uncharacterized protein n=1 Tax=Zancudomyces culisetae TaxID=1213189 RepID=A0A1R1PS94_ZANCU|nr:hypothetical protein AX774_g2674 [Zancudomyces culisetae]|eukprot:OMH83824.1 hypothetical protein AX774_g2674 [Zancudomyces culisetae]
MKILEPFLVPDEDSGADTSDVDKVMEVSAGIDSEGPDLLPPTAVPIAKALGMDPLEVEEVAVVMSI